MWSLSLFTSASRIHLQMEQFSQSTGWTLAEDLEHWKGQERLPLNWIGWKKEEGKKKRRGSGTGPATLVGSWGRGEVPASREAPSLMGKLFGTEGEHLRLLEEGEMTRLWQTGQSETYTVCATALRTPDWNMSASVHEGWELECEDLRANPGRELPLAVRRQPEGMGRGKSTTGNAYGGNLVCHRSKASLLSGMQGVEPTLQPLSPHVLAPASPGAKKGPCQGWPSMCLLLGTRKGPCWAWHTCACCQAPGKAPTGADFLMPASWH